MTVRLFTCHHVVPPQTLTQGMFATLISGRHAAADGSYLGDLDGENIAGDNDYSEIRHQYYVWKNLLGPLDYVGFEHYRRMFFIDPMPHDRLAATFPRMAGFRRGFLAEQLRATYDIDPDSYEDQWAMRRAFTDADTRAASEYIAAHDMLVQRPADARTVEEQWKSCMPPEWWDLIVEAFRQASYFRTRPCLVDVRCGGASWHNMYILRADLFDEYMTLMTEAVAWLRQRVPRQDRLWGHFSERLFNFYLFQKRMEQPLLRVGRLPYLMRSALQVTPPRPGG